MRLLRAAALAALAVGGCGGDKATAPQATREATVATVGACLARAGALAARSAADLEFVVHAKAGAAGAALDGRTTYEFLPRDPAATGEWRVFRTRASDQPKPTAAQAGAAPAPGEEVAALPPPASSDAIKRAQGCADGAPG